MENVSADERRHIGFGVKLLSELAEQDPDCRCAVAELLREVIPWAASVLVPPRWDERYVECFGFTLEDPDDMEVLLESVAAGFDASTVPSEGGILQWEFADADPWHVVVANGATRHVRWRADGPTMTFRSRFEDFVDAVAGRQDPRRLLATRRLRLRGNHLWLWRARDMFPH